MLLTQRPLMTVQAKFEFTIDDSVAQNENYHIVRWLGPGKVVASYVRRGDALSAHFSCDKKGLRHIKQAINDFCEWAFYAFDWCTMIIAMIRRPSVARIVEKCEFKKVADFKRGPVYARCR